MSVMFASNDDESHKEKYLYEFKAGRTKQVPVKDKPNCFRHIPQPERGTVFIERGSDQLLHFCWKDRATNKKELDLIILSNEAKFVPVKECKDGRVFMLKFRNSSTNYCFWLQDANKKKDDEILVKVSMLLKSTPSTALMKLPKLIL